MQKQFSLPADLLETILAPDPGFQVWVVGGALRDHLLGRSYDDIDLVVDGDAIGLARKIANDLSWDFFILDKQRGAARVLPKGNEASIKRVDFSSLRGGNIKRDLLQRDFTINAIAFDPKSPDKLIDPGGGVEDLRMKRLQTCSPDSMSSDPVRAIRAVRFATELKLSLPRNTLAQVKQSVHDIPLTSIERIRDELFRILRGEYVPAAIRLLDHLHILELLFPMSKIDQKDGQEAEEGFSQKRFLLALVGDCAELIRILDPEHDVEAAADAIWGSLSLKLGRYRHHLGSYFDANLSDDRSRLSLVFFTILALIEQLPPTQDGSADVPNSRSFRLQLDSEHPVGDTARRYRLSRQEQVFITKCAAAYDVLEAGRDLAAPTDLDIHRFYREFGDGGISAVLLYLSAAIARSTGPPDPELWESRLNIARKLFEAYYERSDHVLHPVPLLDGERLMQEFAIPPGPEIGRLLDAIREAQVTGKVGDIAEALEFARQIIEVDSG